MNVKLIIAAVAFTLTSYNSNAQVVANAKKASTIQGDKKRIKQGVQNGELTKVETARLANQTRKLKNEKQEIKADGVVKTEERKDYRQDKRKVSRNIYKQKHDAQTRP